MKNIIPLTAMLVLSLFLFSCKKDKKSSYNPPPYDEYLPLKVGNYWVYQNFLIDSLGNATPESFWDTMTVEKDTIINGNSFFNIDQPFVYYSKVKTFIRDSLHYLVNHKGDILFSSYDTTNVLFSHYLMAGKTDTVSHMLRKMTEFDMVTITPAGAFVTRNSRELYFMYPGFNYPEPIKQRNIRFAKNIGLVSETLPLYSSDPLQRERRLISFHLK